MPLAPFSLGIATIQRGQLSAATVQRTTIQREDNSAHGQFGAQTIQRKYKEMKSIYNVGFLRFLFKIYRAVFSWIFLRVLFI